MKNLRIVLAVTAGLLVTAGYILNDGPPWLGPRIIVSVLFGFAIPWGWLREPERSFGQGGVATVAILLSILILFAAIEEPIGKAVRVTLFGLALGGIHFTMARLYQKECRRRLG